MAPGPSARALQSRQCVARDGPRARGARRLRPRAGGGAEPCQRLDQPRHGARGAQSSPGRGRELRPGARARSRTTPTCISTRRCRCSRSATMRRGFAEYEWRWKRTGMTARRRFRGPLWLGEFPLAGKTILLHAEQGLGDTVQFARYAPLLARAGATVVLEVQPELKALLARSRRRRRRLRAASRCRLRRALPAGEPAARLQDRAVQHSSRDSLSARRRGSSRPVAAAPRGAAGRASRWPGPARQPCQRPQPLDRSRSC